MRGLFSLLNAGILSATLARYFAAELPAAAVESSPKTVNIEGYVRSLIGAAGTYTLTLNGLEYSTLSTREGKFTFYNIPSGIYLLEVSSVREIFPTMKIKVAAEVNEERDEEATEREAGEKVAEGVKVEAVEEAAEDGAVGTSIGGSNSINSINGISTSAGNGPKKPKKKITVVEYKYPGAKRLPAAYPIVLTALATVNYFEEHKPLSVYGIISGNPMVIMMLFSLLIVVGFPQLLKNLSPEELKELQGKTTTTAGKGMGSEDPMKSLQQLMGMGAGGGVGRGQDDAEDDDDDEGDE